MKNIFITGAISLLILSCCNTKIDPPKNETTIPAIKKSVQNMKDDLLTIKAKPTSKGLSRPPYPSWAFFLRQQGDTKLNLYLGVDGKVKQALIKKSSGYKSLDDASVEWALKEWNFIPCKLRSNQEPVECWFEVTWSWTIS